MVDKVNTRNSCSFKKTCTCTTFIWHDIDIKSTYTVTKRKKKPDFYIIIQSRLGYLYT